MRRGLIMVALVLLVGGWSIALDTLRIRGDRFYEAGRPIVLVGVNYLASCTKAWGDMWGDWYDGEVVERELAMMEKTGLNCVRITIFWCDAWNPEEGVLDEARVERLQDFMLRAQRHNLYVMLSVGIWDMRWLEELMKDPATGRVSLFDFLVSPVGQRAYEKFLKGLVGAVKNMPSLALMDVMNEPYWANVPRAGSWEERTATPAKCRAWTRWVIEKYGSLEGAKRAWGGELGEMVDFDGRKYLTPPGEDSFLKPDKWCKKAMDYQRFVIDAINAFIKRARRVVKGVKPGLPITSGFGFGGVGGDFSTIDKFHTLTMTQDVRAFTEYVDFVSFHIYEPPRIRFSADEILGEGRITMRDAVGFVRAYCDVGKPVVLQEFGLPGINTVAGKEQEDIQAAAWEVTLEAAYESGCDGVLGWMWCETDTDMMRSGSGWGIIRLDGVPKEAYFVLKEWVERLKRTRKPRPDVTIVIDRAEYLNPMQMYIDGYEMWSALRRKGHIPEVIWKGEKARTGVVIELKPREE